MKISKIILASLLLANIGYGATLKELIDKAKKDIKVMLETKIANGQELNEMQKGFLDGNLSVENYMAKSLCAKNQLFSMIGGCSSDSRFVLLLENFIKNNPNVDVSKLSNSSITNADPYTNKGIYYPTFAIIKQRIDAKRILIYDDSMGKISGRIGLALITDLPKGTTALEGSPLLYMVKGTGEYTYTTVGGVKKIIPKGILVKSFIPNAR